jgi:hypothetical protein
VSTGFGPVGFYSSLSSGSSGGRRGGSRGSTATLSRRLEAAARAEARATAQEEKQRLANELATQFATILNLHREQFPLATPPLAQPPAIPTLAKLTSQHTAIATRGLGVFARKRRRIAKQAALVTANQEHKQIMARAAEQQRAHQSELDAWWGALLRNDPAVVLDALSTAYEDNEAAAAPLGVDGATAFVVVHVPDFDAVPERMPTRTEAGNLSLRKLGKRDRCDYYTSMVCGYLLVTAKEGFAVAPGLEALSLVAIRRGRQDPSGRSAPEPIMAARLERSHLVGIRWDDATSVEVLNATATEKVFSQFGQAKELRPLDPHDHPDIGRALEIVDLNEEPEAASEPAVVAQTPQQLPPAAWYRDPVSRHQLRLWDGQEWTSRVADNGIESADPI